MNLGKSLIVLILLFSVLGLFTFAETMTTVSADNSSPGGQTWIDYNTSNVRMSALTATIKVTIKNTGSHVQYFKISQTYYQTTPAINFTVDWTDPQAERMIDPVSPGLGGDYGWPIQAGETKTVSFKVSATGLMGNEPSWVYSPSAVDNSYWPLIPDMGLYTSWFMPNEIETLNPSLDLQSWCGTFTFTAKNYAEYPVSGIIRGPIIPTDSQLTYSDPEVTFQDRDITLNAGVAAWDISLDPDESEGFVYTYEWPIAAGSGGTGNGSNNLFPVTAANNTTTVPTPTTGTPYGLLALAVVIVGAGIGYAKFLR